jgi:hypothetical protein
MSKDGCCCGATEGCGEGVRQSPRGGKLNIEAKNYFLCAIDLKFLSQMNGIVTL